MLASGSVYRKQLLSRFTTDFTCASPDIDESRLPGEKPQLMALRLATQKARKVAAIEPGSTVIGSDQVASLHGLPLQKPGNYENAFKQLSASSGNTVLFYTAVCVICPRLQGIQSHTDLTRVHFRELTNDEIDDYLRADEPFDCAGSFRSEGLGASLFASVDSADPTALIGLPMEWLSARLKELGYGCRD